MKDSWELDFSVSDFPGGMVGISDFDFNIATENFPYCFTKTSNCKYFFFYNNMQGVVPFWTNRAVENIQEGVQGVALSVTNDAT